MNNNHFFDWKLQAEKIAYWTLPPGLSHFFRSKIRKFMQFKDGWHKDLSFQANRLKKFKNKHYGKNCFILATGPSIKKQDLKVLRNEICFGVSQFMLHPDISIINPNYHIEAPNHPPFDYDLVNTCIRHYEKYYTPKTIYFFGYTPYQYSIFNFLKQQHHKLCDENVFHVNYSTCNFIDEKNFKDPSIWDISLSPFLARTIIYIAIQIAAYMGFKNIYLIGCDHDYLQDLGRMKNQHFYTDDKSGIDDVEHLSQFDTEWWLNQYYLRWKEYRLMKEYLNSKGQQIFNATEGGMLDVFPRIALEDAISNGKAG